MFDLRRFWLATSVFVLIIGGVIAAVGAAFSAFISMPTKGHQQVVTQPAPIQAAVVPIQAAVVKEAPPVELERTDTTPAALPPSPSSSVHRKRATKTAVATPQIAAPKPLIVPERKSTRRGGSSD
jgi:hypothetical protein